MARKKEQLVVEDGVVEELLPPPDRVDKSKPYIDAQYDLISKLPNDQKRAYMSGFKDTAEWSEEDIKRHYQAAHFPEVRYHSSGGGGKGTVSPPGLKY